MELKELKKEIDGMERVDLLLLKFKKSWLKQIKPNTNKQFPFLNKLDAKTRKQLNVNLETHQKVFNQLRYARFTQEKISSLAHYLIELKLASFNGDTKKPQVLINKFINDDFLKLTNVINEVDQFEFNLTNFKQIYDGVNNLVSEQLTLEESLLFMGAAHQEHLAALFQISQKQKKLLKSLGTEFIALVKEMKKKKRL
ncbi:MAG: hypothetical protein ABIA37_01550 [Candidatus Woesearchaeota archaeon]